VNPSLSLNVVRDVQQLFDYPFMVNALQAGTLVAIAGALVGWFMVLRRQSFAGHTLSVMAFPGAAAAAWAGVPLAYGYYAACTLAALALGRSRTRRRDARSAESAAIGIVQAAGLAAGFLFLSLAKSVLSGLEDLLFGSFLGISDGQVRTLLVVCLVVGTIVVLSARPLLFASIDPTLAAVHGVPVGLLSGAFLLVLGLAVAAISQITGVLLVFALLVSPAASAQALTARPLASLGLSVAFALATCWLGLGLAYYSPYPVGFFIASIAFALYLLARLFQALRERRPIRAPRVGLAR
jgi:zinc/manganese transport system permease protein